jgi:hypothetical protein
MKKLNYVFASLFIVTAFFSCNMYESDLTGFTKQTMNEATLPACDVWVDETAWASTCFHVIADLNSWSPVIDYNTEIAEPEGPDYFVNYLIAGQNMRAGVIYFWRPNEEDMVRVGIRIYSGFRFAACEENVKAEGWSIVPSGTLKPGKFGYKFTSDPSASYFYFMLPLNNYYAVHVDVERYIPCPE